jgi:tripartite-type tricarboxylate transporter receptor subunit TctC
VSILAPLRNTTAILFRLFITSLFLVTFAHAQKWPEKPVRMILAYPAGGNSDVAARILAPRLQEIFGQAFLVENKPGAGGMIAGELVAKAPADGHTLFFTANAPILFSPMVYGRTPYIWHRDFVAVAPVSYTPLALVTHPSVQAKTVAELIGLAKARPNQLMMACSGVASTNHLLSELLQMASGASWETIQYKGNAPASTDLLGGQVQFAFEQVSVSLPHVRSGKLRALAVATAKRVRTMPDVPTFAEAGYEGIEGETFTALFAPAGTSREVVMRLSTAITTVLQDKVVIEKFAALGAEARSSTPEEFTEYLRREDAKWTPVIKRANIRAE